MKRSLQLILVFIVVFCACRPRSSAGLADDPQDAAQADSSRVDTLEVMIESLKNQLETNEKISAAERDELEQKIKRAEEAKGSAPTPTPSPTPAAPKVDGPYTIYFDNDCLQPLDPNNLVDASTFRAYPCNGTQGQQFALEMRDNGYFRILHRLSNKCLVMSGNATVEGTPPTLLPCKALSENAEQWRFVDAAADGSNFKLQSRLSNYCLKIGNDGTIFQGNCATNYTTFMLKKST